MRKGSDAGPGQRSAIGEGVFVVWEAAGHISVKSKYGLKYLTRFAWNRRVDLLKKHQFVRRVDTNAK
jgi:hypothetical protein